MGQLDATLKIVLDSDAISARMGGTDVTNLEDALARKINSSMEKETLERAISLAREIIAVDDFAPEDVSPLWNRPRAGSTSQ